MRKGKGKRLVKIAKKLTLNLCQMSKLLISLVFLWKTAGSPQKTGPLFSGPAENAIYLL